MKKKPLKKIEGKRPSGLRDLTYTNMKRYFASIDWIEWWEEFYLAVGNDGLSKYRSVYQFAVSKKKNQKQLEFLRYYLGPKEADDPRAEEYPFCTPQDWASKRETGGWWSPELVKAASKEIRKIDHALSALREVGGSYMLHPIIRTEKLDEQIDSEFKGRLFVPGLSMKANEDRARLYLSLKHQVQSLRNQQFDVYCKSHGINFADMAGIQSLIGALAAREHKEMSEATREGAKALTEIVSMMVTKHQKYGMELPESMVKKVIDVKAEAEEKDAKKRGLQ